MTTPDNNAPSRALVELIDQHGKSIYLPKWEMLPTLEKLRAWLADPAHITRRVDLGYEGKVFISREHLKTADGANWSVQQSGTHYCDANSVELWCCPHHALLEPYGDGEDPYGYVPLEVLAKVLEDHGGII